jgi:hypothetical protein
MCEGHAQVNHYEFNDPVEFAESAEANGIATILDMELVRFDQANIIVGFSLYVMDTVVAADRPNETEILSDTLSVARDFYNILVDPEIEYIIEPAVTLEPFVEKLQEMWAGYKMTFTLSWIDGPDRCAIPTDDAITKNLTP